MQNDAKALKELARKLRDLMSSPSFDAFTEMLRRTDAQALDAIRTLPDHKTEEARAVLRFNESLRNQFRGALEKKEHNPF